MNIEEYLEKLISKFGVDHQLTVAVEELSELQKELCKVIRSEGNAKKLFDEFADVCLVMEEIKRIFNISDDQIKVRMQSKIIRTIDRYKLS